MSFTTCVYVVLGGAIGTFARYGISILALSISRQLPWGTIIINVTGCALIGFIGTPFCSLRSCQSLSGAVEST